MTDTWVYVDEDANIRQGDIIKRCYDFNNRTIQEFGVIITADCDIAHKKYGDRLTILEILPGHEYISNYWAIDQIKRLIDKEAKAALDGMNKLIKENKKDLSDLTLDSLSYWLSRRNADEIFSLASPSCKKNDTKLLDALRALRIAHGHEGYSKPLEQLRATWSALGKSIIWQQNQIKDIFKIERGFPDFFFVPALPHTEGYGFTVMLRNILSINKCDLYNSEISAKIDNNPTAYYRIGKFSECIKYAVSQKFAFLFSRIGMPVDFEDTCNVASEIMFTTL